MPNQELIDELQNQIDQRQQEFDENWPKEEVKRFIHQVKILTKYLENHPGEDCVFDALEPECKKMRQAQEDVISLLEHAKNKEVASLLKMAKNKVNLENLKYLRPLYKGVYEIIHVYYPNTRFKMLCQAINKVKATTIETAIKKGINLVIADAASEAFKKDIDVCCKKVSNPNCLCLLIQTLMSYDFEHESISRVFCKSNQATRQLWQRCRKKMAEQFDKGENEI